MDKNQKALPMLRLEAVIVDPREERAPHVIKFNYNNLDERHAFNVRMEDCLNQGYLVAMQKVDPVLERLFKKKGVTVIS